MLSADAKLFRWLNDLTGHYNWFDQAVRLCASDFFLPVLMTVLVFGLWFYGKDQGARRLNQYAFLYASMGVGISNLFVRFFDHFVQRTRPFIAMPDVHVILYQPSDPSFPSNAAAVAASLVAGVYLTNKKYAAVIAIPSILFSLSRIIVGMHYPLDIVGGAAFGILTTWFFAKLLVVGFTPLRDWAFRLVSRFYSA